MDFNRATHKGSCMTPTALKVSPTAKLAEPEFRLGFDCEDGLGAMSDGRKEVLAIVPLGGSGRDLAGDG